MTQVEQIMQTFNQLETFLQDLLETYKDDKELCIKASELQKIVQTTNRTFFTYTATADYLNDMINSLNTKLGSMRDAIHTLAEDAKKGQNVKVAEKLEMIL